jgi:glycosyltransferase involved in cell wall biosynthesis
VNRQSPLVSVVVPVHGAAPYLEHALRSVVEQQYGPVELIVVDERAEAQLADRVRKVARDAVITVSSAPGPACARNSGLALANGRYVAFLDCDDVWLPKFLARLVAVMEDDPGVGVACAGFVQIDRDGGLVRRPLRRRFRRGFAVPAILIDSLIAPSTSLCRTDAVRDIGGWPDRLQFEDRAFFTRLAQGVEFVYVDELLALYRIHQGNRTTIEQPGWLQGLIDVSKDALAGQEARPGFARLKTDLDTHIELMTGQMYRKAGYRRRPIQAALRAMRTRPSWPEPYFLLARTLLPGFIATRLRNRVDPPRLAPEIRERIQTVLEPSWP